MAISAQQLRQKFHHLINMPICYDTASVFDPISARIAHELGFELGILGGSVASLQVLAAPDFALITLTEFIEQATRIGRVMQLPMIADADHGYGNALNASRTVQELERIGFAMLTLEDTLLPAQFHCKSTDLVSIAEMTGKLKAACAARCDRSLAIFARTHVGFQNEEMLWERLQNYQRTEIDGICLSGVRDIVHLEKICSHIQLPLMLITYNNPHLHDLAKLAQLGVRIVVNGHTAYFASIKAIYDSMRHQRKVNTNDLDASALAAHYSDLEHYRQWAKQYMQVEE